MDAARRIYLTRIAERVDQNRKYADKIGTKNKSNITTDRKKNLGGIET